MITFKTFALYILEGLLAIRNQNNLIGWISGLSICLSLRQPQLTDVFPHIFSVPCHDFPDSPIFHSMTTCASLFRTE